MKIRYASALSVVGVLGAGAVATAANTSILAGDSGSATSSTVITLPAAQTTAAPITPPAPPSSEPIDSPTLASISTNPEPERTTFNVGDAGALTVDSVDGHLALISAVAHDGWTPSEITITPDGLSIAMNFVSATTQVWVRIVLVDGTPVPEIATNYVPGAVVPPATGAAAGSDGSTALNQAASGSSNAAVAPANTATASPVKNYEDDDDEDEDEDDDDDDEGEDD